MSLRQWAGRFLDVPLATMLAVAAGSLFAMGVSPNWLKMPIGVAAVLALVATRMIVRGQQRDRWKQSVAAFDKCMFDFGAWFDGRIDWEKAARESRYPPKLSAAPVREWEAGDGRRMLTAEDHLLLKIAEDVYAPEYPTLRHVMKSEFHKKRAEMTEQVGYWVKWNHQPGFRAFIGKAIQRRRNVLIFLAYLEIVLARKHGDDDNSSWTHIAELWPECLACTTTQC
jgi:hypothetical protein